jgi:hypothetical protein
MLELALPIALTTYCFPTTFFTMSAVANFVTTRRPSAHFSPNVAQPGQSSGFGYQKSQVQILPFGQLTIDN